MTDNRDPIGTGLPNADDIPADVDNFPPTPEWEKAFAEYAKQQAPDLMPRILAQINQAGKASADMPQVDRVQADSAADSAASMSTSKSKGSRLIRFFGGNRQTILSLAGVAAAVIIVGMLVIMSDALTTGKTKSDSPREEKNATVATPTDCVAPSTATPGGPKGSGKDPDDIVDDRPDNPFDPRREEGNEYLYVEPYKGEESHTQAQYRYILRESGSDNPGKLNLVLQVPLTLTTRKNQSEDPFGTMNASGTEFLLSGITIGDSVETECGTVHHTVFSGKNTNILLLWDQAESGQTCKELTLSYMQSLTIRDEVFRVFLVISDSED